MIEILLLSLLIFGPLVYLWGCHLDSKSKLSNVGHVFEEQSAYYHIPGLEGSDIHESELEDLK